MLSQDSNFQEVYHSTVHNVKLYCPVDIVNGYHINRYKAASIQGIYSASGATKDLTAAIYQQVKNICNEAHQKKDNKAFMDINTLMDNLIYRHNYPVDGDCILRMGCIYLLLDDEDPNDYQQHISQKKEDYCKGKGLPGTPGYLKADYDMYTFFLTWGQRFTDAYKEPLTDITDVPDYLSKREKALNGLIPAPSQQ